MSNTFGASGAYGRSQPAYLTAYGVAQSDCAMLDAKIAELEANKIPWYKQGHKAWKDQLESLKAAKATCERGSPSLDIALPSIDTSTTSSALPIIGAGAVLSLAALATFAVVSRRKNPRRRNRR
jgi:hypothetical protein